MSISVLPAGGAAAVEPIKSAVKQGAGDFRSALEGAVAHVEQTRAEANQSVHRFLSGEGEELHTTLLATQKADLEFEMFLQVRNKVVGAYQEIMKMQV